MSAFPQRLSTRTLYESDYICLYADTVRMPDGSIIPAYHRLHHPHDAACVAVQNTRGEVLLITSKRYITGRTEWELPAGRVEDGETPEQAARRECMEETGCTLQSLTPLCSFQPENGMSDLTVHAFCATVDAQDGAFDTNEVAARRWAPRAEALQMLRENRLHCGVSMLLYALTFCGEKP